jgi:hypothetical protein
MALLYCFSNSVRAEDELLAYLHILDFLGLHFFFFFPG